MSSGTTYINYNLETDKQNNRLTNMNTTVEKKVHFNDHVRRFHQQSSTFDYVFLNRK